MGSQNTLIIKAAKTRRQEQIVGTVTYEEQ